ncbi:MAG: hypothetical protein M1818_002566 [Claussenomyces sp. TS43310]|nr:MAG: hypothetical protein M1818_002566 [Claussenomyces sp. TS43310]
MAVSVDPATRKKVLKVIFISLLLDLISFTFILPLFPKLLDFYRSLEVAPSSAGSRTLLAGILDSLNKYKNSFSRPIDSRYDVVLLGGAMGSLFSALQAIASPVIGILSDRYGRRKALLVSMCGNILSVLLWLLATDFRTFLLSRIVGGLSEGNVQIATSIATDISSEAQRGSTMALVGACFSIAFTFGPALGAYLSTISTVAANPFATAAGFSLFLIVVETLYLYLYLPETLPSITSLTPAATSATADLAPRAASTRSKARANDSSAAATTSSTRSPAAGPPGTNSYAILNLTHLTFILFFSGMEFSLPFMTHDLFDYSAAHNGRLLGFVGLVASLLQGGVTRRLPPLRNVQLGTLACLAAFFLLARVASVAQLYLAAALLAVTSATVVTGLNSLCSLEAPPGERGARLGSLRSCGQIGRATGPLAFCTLYWWAGREVAYFVGGSGMLGVVALIFLGLRAPRVGAKSVGPKAKAEL